MSEVAGQARTALSDTAIALAGATLSLLLSNQVAGQSNNQFHLSILAGLWREPQFAGDAFIQSLRHYASGFWLPLTGTVDSDRVYPLLFGFALLSRLLFFAGALAAGTALGVRTRAERLIFAGLVALAATLRDVSRGGGGGLFIGSFTQSEVANGTTLLVLAWAARGRIAASFAMNGVTFFLNAFVAVWNAMPLALIVGLKLYRRAIPPRRAAIQAAIGLVLAALAAAPVIVNILGNPEFGRPIGFDYVRFLTEYWPYHFLVGSLPGEDVIWLAGTLAAALLAARELRRDGEFLVAALTGFALVWLAGAVLPSLSHAPALLNLHLLRSSGSIQFCAAIAFAALAARWLTGPDAADRRVWGCGVALLSATDLDLVPLIAVLLLARRYARLPGWSLRLSWRAATALTLLAAAAVTAQRHWVEAAQFRRDRADWQAAGRWARGHTPLFARFLLPVPARFAAGDDDSHDALIDGSEVFSFFAHRQIWVTGKQGAAAMWTPSYYTVWRRRMAETVPLASTAARLAYARAHGIAYVIDGCGGAAPVARFGRLCLFAA